MRPCAARHSFSDSWGDGTGEVGSKMWAPASRPNSQSSAVSPLPGSAYWRRQVLQGILRGAFSPSRIRSERIRLLSSSLSPFLLSVVH